MSWEHLNYFLEDYFYHIWAALLSVILVVGLLLAPDSFRLVLWQSLFAPHRASQRLLAGMILGFGLLLLSLLWSAGQRLDAWVFYHFNWRGARPRWLDRVMWLITQLGNGSLAVVMALVFWQIGELRLANALGLGSLVLWLVVDLLKSLVRRPRPFVQLAQTRIVGMRALGRSFPSGHTAQAFFQFTLLILHFRPPIWGAALLLTAAALISITRMYVGAHYPRDVLAGAILGTAFALVAALL